MEIDYTGGTAYQREVTTAAASSLINFPLSAMHMGIWDISFVADPDEGKSHNEFAITTVATKEQGYAETRIRSDAPDFEKSGRDWSGILFYYESVAHELGHGLFWNLPSSRRLAVCRMFGVDTDDPAVIYPTELAWEDRIGEGIAETFKDAFMPPSLRRYYNRTNHKIPIAAYPRFRSLFRFEGATGFNYLYGSSSFRVDLSDYDLTELPYHRSDHDDEAFVFYEEIKGYEQGWGVDMSQFKESTHHPFSIGDNGPIVG